MNTRKRLGIRKSVFRLRSFAASGEQNNAWERAGASESTKVRAGAPSSALERPGASGSVWWRAGAPRSTR